MTGSPDSVSTSKCRHGVARPQPTRLLQMRPLIVKHACNQQNCTQHSHDKGSADRSAEETANVKVVVALTYEVAGSLTGCF